LNWWASWYPGAEPGGGGYIAQRIFSAKNEKHSLGATLWFNIAHYAVRPWPWILTALVALLLFPNPVNPTTGKFDPEFDYMMVMIKYLPPYLRGLMLAGFAAAYMSTMATHINLGASYLINDFYRRFVRRGEDETHYVLASRLTTVGVTILAAVASFYMESIGGAWKFLLSIGAGAGLVFMLRWFWWRINAWSEISAMVAAGFCSSLLQTKAGLPVVQMLSGIDPKLPMQVLDGNDPHGFAWLMILTTGFTTIVWLTVTFLTAPEPLAKLSAFYDTVRPSSFGWGPIAQNAGFETKQSLLWSAADWVAGCGLIYFSLFGVGRIIFGPMSLGLLYLVGAALCVGFIYWDLNRRGWDTLSQ
jgi:solute:Na+ symporter, SSS family